MKILNCHTNHHMDPIASSCSDNQSHFLIKGSATRNLTRTSKQRFEQWCGRARLQRKNKPPILEQSHALWTAFKKVNYMYKGFIFTTIGISGVDSKVPARLQTCESHKPWD